MRAGESRAVDEALAYDVVGCAALADIEDAPEEALGFAKRDVCGGALTVPPAMSLDVLLPHGVAVHHCAHLPGAPASAGRLGGGFTRLPHCTAALRKARRDGACSMDVFPTRSMPHRGGKVGWGRRDAASDACGRYTTRAPKGSNESFAILKACSPKGMPMMVMQNKHPARSQ